MQKISPMKEDYLKVIFELGGTKDQVSNKKISLALNIAPGSVTEMIKKLVEQKLVKHVPYAGITLTNQGIKVAEKLVRNHRIWEEYLVKELGYNTANVNNEAEVLEHDSTPRLINAMYDKLGHPTKCPHGGIIPDMNGHYQEESHTLLNDAKDGQTVIVQRFIDNHDLLTYLGDIRLELGDKLKIIQHAPFEGPLTVINLANNQQIQISYKAAHYIFVELAN